MILGMLLFSQIAASCAPGEAASTLASVATVESKMNTLAIHDNTSGISYAPIDEDAATRLATALIVAQGHSVDVGVMQIDSENLSRVGLSIRDAFDACHSIAAGSRILKDGYQLALREAFSRYNTGNASRGFSNGYVRRVEAAGAHLPAMDGTSPPVVTATLDRARPPAAPVPVLDMLHSNQVAAAPPSEDAGNLLSGVAPLHVQENPGTSAAAVSQPAT